MLVHGLIHQGTKAILGGSSKAGKTWLLMDLAISVASGTPFLSWPTTSGRVLLINMEIHEAFLRQRFQTMFSERGIEPVDQLDVLTLRGQQISASELLPTLSARLSGGGYSLVIIDPIYKLMTGRSENGDAAVGTLCQQIECLVVETGAAVIYAKHYPKGYQAAKRPLDRLSGSGVSGRDADTVLTLTEHQVEDCYTVEATVRNLPTPSPIVVEWDFPRMVIRSDLEPEQLRSSATGGAQRSADIVLGTLVRPLSNQDWLQASIAAGVSRATFFRARQRLEDRRLVVFLPAMGWWQRMTPEAAEPMPRLNETGETTETETPSRRTPTGARPSTAHPRAQASPPPVTLPPFEAERRIFIPLDPPPTPEQPPESPPPVAE